MSQIKHIRDYLHTLCCRYGHFAPQRVMFPVLWVTNRCNSRCLMCDQWREIQGEKSELSTEQWLRGIDSLSQLKPRVVVITGGEPFVRDDIHAIIRSIRKRMIACHVCSNGILINERIIKDIGDAGLNSLSISMDSFSREGYEKIRGVDRFADVCAAIKMLKNRAPSIKVGINCCISKQNIRDIFKMVDFAESLGVSQIKFDMVHTNLLHHTKNKENLKDLLFESSDGSLVEYEVNRLLKALRRTKLLTNSSYFLKMFIPTVQGKIPPLRCFAGYISCVIDARGRVAPCDRFVGVGDIRTEQFGHIWSSREFGGLRTQVRQCKTSCWDSTHAELNIRCSAGLCISNLSQIYREARYYMDNTVP